MSPFPVYNLQDFLFETYCVSSQCFLLEFSSQTLKPCRCIPMAIQIILSLPAYINSGPFPPDSLPPLHRLYSSNYHHHKHQPLALKSHSDVHYQSTPVNKINFLPTPTATITMSPAISIKSSFSSIKSRDSSHASAARFILATEGYDAFRAYMEAQQAQDAANAKADAERHARKEALHASLARGRKRAQNVLAAPFSLLKRS